VKEKKEENVIGGGQLKIGGPQDERGYLGPPRIGPFPGMGLPRPHQVPMPIEPWACSM
jgi:hypothetical protein